MSGVALKSDGTSGQTTGQFMPANRPSTWSVVHLRPPCFGPTCCNQPPPPLCLHSLQFTFMHWSRRRPGGRPVGQHKLSRRPVAISTTGTKSVYRAMISLPMFPKCYFISRRYFAFLTFSKIPDISLTAVKFTFPGFPDNWSPCIIHLFAYLLILFSFGCANYMQSLKAVERIIVLPASQIEFRSRVAASIWMQQRRASWLLST